MTKDQKIQAALRHVNLYHPEVSTVFYGVDGSWCYCFDEMFEAPVFEDNIDIDILNDAADAAEHPSVHVLKKLNQ